MVNLYITVVDNESPKVHANFQDDGTSGSKKKGFFKVLAINGHDGHLGHVTQTIFMNLCPPFPRRLHIKIYFD